MIDHHGIRITFYSTGRTTRYSQQVAGPQDTNRIARESVDLTRLTARVFRAVVAWTKSSVRLIVRPEIYYLSADPLSLIYRVFRLSTFTTLMALAIRREIRPRGCLNFSGAEASNPSRISERLFGLRRRRKLSACQTDVNHSLCRPNFNDCAAHALSGAPKKKMLRTLLDRGISRTISSRKEV